MKKSEGTPFVVWLNELDRLWRAQPSDGHPPLCEPHEEGIGTQEPEDIESFFMEWDEDMTPMESILVEYPEDQQPALQAAIEAALATVAPRMIPNDLTRQTITGVPLALTDEELAEVFLAIEAKRTALANALQDMQCKTYSSAVQRRQRSNSLIALTAVRDKLEPLVDAMNRRRNRYLPTPATNTGG